MLDAAQRPVLSRQLPWRPILVLLIIALLLAASLAFVIGSQRRLPAPFGPARNGVVGYVLDGDIYTADPATGVSTLIVGGLDPDSAPIWSPDGTHLAFIRGVNGETSSTAESSNFGLIYITDAGGRLVTQVTARPLVNISWMEFSPDGRSISIASETGHTPGGRPEAIHRIITIAASDGSAVSMLDLQDRLPAGHEPNAPTFRPHDGAEILFTAYVNDDVASEGGIYLIDEGGETLTTLVEPQAGVMIFLAEWSPDGSRIAYTTVEGDVWRVHVMSVDDRVDRVIHKDGARSEGWESWSPDGTRLLIQRIEADGSNGYVVVPANGQGPEVRILSAAPPDGAHYVWAPDGTSIMATPDNHPKGKPLIWDPMTGIETTAPWTAESYPIWQRVAP